MKTTLARTALDEQTLAKRTQAARAQGTLQAAILFGSHARGDHHAQSDWDVCIIGGACTNSAIEAIQGQHADADWPIDLVWTPTDRALREASYGTVWAQIVQEGRVIAGDPQMLKNMTIKPMTANTVDHRLGQTTGKLSPKFRVRGLRQQPRRAGRRFGQPGISGL